MALRLATVTALASLALAVGLGLVIAIYRCAHTADLDQINRMKG